MSSILTTRQIASYYLDIEIMETAMQPAPFRPAGIDHVVLRVADAPRVLAFYENVLGRRLERHQADIGLWQLLIGPGEGGRWIPAKRVRVVTGSTGAIC